MSPVQVNILHEQYMRAIQEIAVLGSMIEQLQQPAESKAEMTRDEAWGLLMSELEKGSKSSKWYSLEECFGEYGE